MVPEVDRESCQRRTDRYNPDDHDIIRTGDLLEESSVYQDILRKGFLQGLEQARAEMRERGHEEGERRVLLIELETKLGKLPAKTKFRVDRLSIDKVEELAEDLLDFRSGADLNDWLRNNTGY